MTAAISNPTHPALPGMDSAPRGAAGSACFHCGTPCTSSVHRTGDRNFCCAGCLAVHELLRKNGLDTSYYSLNAAPGRRIDQEPGPDRYAFLDEPAVRSRLLDFESDRRCRVTFHIPAIHCVACVWLLENLFRLQTGIGSSTVNFLRREASISFDPTQVPFSRVAGLVDSLGYAPDLKLSDLDARRGSEVPRRLWLQLGVAAFAFGNTMLFSLPGYFGLDTFSGPAFQRLFGILSLVLGVPVVAFSAADYWRTAWFSLRQRRLSIEVPIALGIAALFCQSAYEVLSGHGEGYFDSMGGLLFFLLCGRVFQHKAYDRLTFDRDYRAFFPLSVIRVRDGSEGSVPSEQRVSLAHLSVGDRIRIRHGELVPADGRLLQGTALMDYSFVTGESEPITVQPGERVHAGGCQQGGTLEVEITRPVSQSYLTSLWDQETFRKEKTDTFGTLTNRYSVRFTAVILAIAVVSAIFWAFQDPSRSVRALVGVLIVACPCALALAAPFTLGTAVRALGRRGVFLRNAQVIETLARINTVVFDKTGTLTAGGEADTVFEGTPLSTEEADSVRSLALQSSHPLSARIARVLTSGADRTASVENFHESTGRGISGRIQGRLWLLGSAELLRESGIAVDSTHSESAVHLAVDGHYRGRFRLVHPLRPEAGELVQSLNGHYQLALLSGDNDREQQRFQRLFGVGAALQFRQSPADKLTFIQNRQKDGGVVMMVGDGLNDAGALRQSDVGVAVVEHIGAFSPASDVIVEACRVPHLGELLRFSHNAVAVVRASFLISTLYNGIGISIAAAGRLSPVVCAVLMPLSSVTVVAFAALATQWQARRARLGPLVSDSLENGSSNA